MAAVGQIVDSFPAQIRGAWSDNQQVRTISASKRVTVGRAVWLLVAVALFALSASAGETGPSGARSLSIVDGRAVVPAHSYVAWRVFSEARRGGDPVIVGRLQAEGAGRPRVAIAVLTEADFTSWKRGYSTTPIYLSGEVVRADVRARLPGPGVYYVVASNLFSARAPKTIRGTLTLSWVPSSGIGVAPAAPSSADYRRDLLSFCAVLILAGVLALWSIQGRRSTEEIPVDEKVA